MPSPADQRAQPASSSSELPNKELRVRCAYVLSDPAPHRLNLDEVLRWEPTQGPLWVHLDHVQIIPEWLKERHAIDATVLESLRADARRPRLEVVHHDNLVIIFRTLNIDLAPTADSTQTTRVWGSPTRVLTMSDSNPEVFEDCARQIESGRGPKTVPEFLVRLMEGVVNRAELIVLQIDADLTDVELDQEKGIVLPPE